MTTKDERLRSIVYTKDFLYRLVGLQGMYGQPPYKRVPKEVKGQARTLLRHFPGEGEAERMCGHED